MKILFFLSLFMTLGQAQAAGYFRSGGDLEELVTSLASKLHVDKPTFAKGYVAGVADATFGVSWCPKSQVTEERIFQTVSQFIKSHPDYLNQRAASVVGDALATEFPCNKK
ncbi:MAG: hypothetical protein M0Q22_09980 [Sulfuritalea sp.]|jgi:hypothetical protein|nr:hypothetical protein [Sulfuritalea sp.]